MNLAQLNDSLVLLISKKKELASMSYNDDRYDDVEEELHNLEDQFLSNYGPYLEEALHEVHDEYCPDNEVLLPIAYLPCEFRNGDMTIEIDNSQGVYVDVDDYDETETKLVLAPNPVRLILNIGKSRQEVVWQAGGLKA